MTQDTSIPVMRGHVDHIGQDGRISGWCWAPHNPHGRRSITVYVEGTPAATVSSDNYRQDLADAGIGDGMHAFLVELPKQYLPMASSSSIVVCDSETGFMLPSSGDIGAGDDESNYRIQSRTLPIVLGNNDSGRTVSVRLLVSILNFHTSSRTEKLLSYLPEQLQQFCDRTGSTVTIKILNNSHAADTEFLNVSQMRSLSDVKVLVESNPANNGFGAGHNQNFRSEVCDIFLVMNNDLGFGHTNWLDAAVARILSGEVAALGDSDSPGLLEKNFGFAPNAKVAIEDKEYVEGSILLISSEAFRKVGGFSSIFEFAYFEDADLSLKIRAHGLKFGFLPIPHEHYRASSTSRFGDPFYSSMFEHSRAAFFGRWNEWLEKKSLSKFFFVALNHDGIGDILQAAAPIRAFARSLAESGFTLHLQLSYQDLQFLFDDIGNIEFVKYKKDCVYSGVFVLGDLNLAAPLPTAALFAARLGIVEFSSEFDFLYSHCGTILVNRLEQLGLSQQEYIVLHLDSQRLDFEGRAIDRTVLPVLYEAIARTGKKVVLIGSPDKAASLSMEYEEYVSQSGIRDLRGQTTFEDLISIIRFAAAFVGIDSGPANAALILGIPSFLMFGSVSAYAKLRDISNVVIYESPKVTCHGCYHRNVEPSYAICYRRDQACVRDISSEPLSSLFSKFLNLRRHTSDNSYSHWMREQARLARLMIFNPLYRNKIIRPGEISGKRYSDAFIELVAFAEQLVGSRTRDSLEEYRILKDEVFALKEELSVARAMVKGQRRRDRALAWGRAAGIQVDAWANKISIGATDAWDEDLISSAETFGPGLSGFLAKGSQIEGTFLTPQFTLVVKVHCDTSEIRIQFSAASQMSRVVCNIPELDIYGAELGIPAGIIFHLVIRHIFPSGSSFTLDVQTLSTPVGGELLPARGLHLGPTRAFSRDEKRWL